MGLVGLGASMKRTQSYMIRTVDASIQAFDKASDLHV